MQEIENPSDSPRDISLDYPILDVKMAENSDNYYYLSGKNQSSQPYFVKVNPRNDTVTELVPAGAYDIYSLTVSSNDEVLFNALRMSDGAKVVGKISSTGNISILDDGLGIQTTVLERIQ